MKNLFLSLFIAGLLILPFTSNVTEANSKTLKFGLGEPLASDQGVFALRFKEIIEEATKGEFTIDLFPNGQMGSEQEMFQGARMGTLDMSVGAVNNLTPFCKSIGTLTLPYLIKNHKDAVKLTTGALNDHWVKVAQKEAGVRIIGWAYSNFRVLTNSKHPITTIDDLKGLKIRVPKNPIMIETYKAWGVNPLPMAWTEVFTGLQQKVVDGQDNPNIINYNMKFHEVQKYTSNIHYLYLLQPVAISESLFRKLSPELQVTFKMAGLQAQQYQMLDQLVMEAEAVKAMKKSGIEYTEVSDEEIWKEKSIKAVWPKFYDTIGGKEAVDQIVEKLK